MTLNCRSRTRDKQFLLSEAALHRAVSRRFNTLDFPVAGMNAVLQADPHHRHPRPWAIPREPWLVLIFGILMD